MRLRRCGLKGVAFLYVLSDKDFMHIQPVLVRVLHGAAKYIAAIALVIYRIGKIVIYHTAFSAVRQRPEINRVLESLHKRCNRVKFRLPVAVRKRTLNRIPVDFHLARFRVVENSLRDMLVPPLLRGLSCRQFRRAYNLPLIDINSSGIAQHVSTPLFFFLRHRTGGYVLHFYLC